MRRHDRRTQFALQGGHAGVACEKCHTFVKLMAGVPVTFYKPAPLKCAACHGKEEE
jgi:hypothetical protein